MQVRKQFLGVLYPFGHPAVFQQFVERIFDADPSAGGAAVLRTVSVLTILNPVRQPPTDGPIRRAFPLGVVEMTNTQFTHLADPEWQRFRFPAPAGEQPTYFTPKRPNPADPQRPLPVQFPLTCSTVVAGQRREVQLSVPLIFVVDMAPLANSLTNPALADVLVGAYSEAQARITPTDVDLIGAGTRLSAEQSADVFEVHALTIAGHGSNLDLSGGYRPRLSQLEVALPALRPLLDREVRQAVVFTDDYLKKGLSEHVVLKMTQSIGIDFTGKADRSGGLVAPSYLTDAISRRHGPINLAALRDSTSSGTDPSKLFPDDTATLLGFPLRSLLSGLDRPPQITSLPNPAAGARPTVQMRWEAVKLTSQGGAFIANRDGRDALLDLTVTTGLDAAQTKCNLTDFTLRFPPGDNAVLELSFASMSFTQEGGGAPKLTVGGVDAKFIGDLALVQKLEEAVDLGETGKLIDVTPGGISLRYRLPAPAVSSGVFVMSNIAFTSVVTIPFDSTPMSIALGFSSRANPFQLAVMMFGGTGYLELELTRDGIQRFEAALEFGAFVAVDFLIASGEVHALGGVRFVYDRGNVSIAGYLRIGGSVEVLGLISVSIELCLSLEYRSEANALVGRATLVIEIDLTLWSDSVTLDSGEWRFPGGDQQRTVLASAPPSGPTGLELWARIPKCVCRQPSDLGLQMSEQINEILWVAVPDGLTGGTATTQAVIRVLMVPRLSGSNIDRYPFLEDWPGFLAELADGSIFVASRKAGGQERRVEPKSVSQANSAAWKGFFGGEAGNIEPFAAKTFRPPTVRSSYTSGTKAHLTYRGATEDVVKPNAKPEKVIRDQLDAGGWADDPDDPAPPPSVGRPNFAVPDFHAVVAMLREHPAVLRELGLTFEVTVSLNDLTGGAGTDDLQLSVTCDDPQLRAPFLVSPWTRYHLDPVARLFRPAPAPGSDSGIRAGLLHLEDSQNLIELTENPAEPKRWAIATFDIDGAVGGLRQTARDLAARSDVEAAMPPVRSAGLLLLRTDRQADFTARADAGRAAAPRSLSAAVLSAEDLVLGYRLDIRHGDGQWRSVCERRTRYTIDVDGEQIVLGATATDGFVEEEGHVKPFAAVRDSVGALHADDVVVRWDGWNLALPKLNLAEDTPPPEITDGDLVPYVFGFEHQLRPGRLPVLRFANDYQMRIRIADLAGGGMAFKDRDSEDDGQSQAVTYRRHEPVPPSQLTPLGDFSVGAALDRVVIRSDDGRTVAELAAAEGYPTHDARRLDPPTTSLPMIEAHGALDDRTLQASFELAQRALAAEADGSRLPDWIVAAVNATVRDASGAEQTQSEPNEWYDDQAHPWPDYQPKRIELRPAALGAAQLDIEWEDDPQPGLPTRTLVLTLGKGKQAIVELTSTLRQGTVDHVAAGEFFRNDTASATATRAGRNHVVTPPRRILAVHAVKLPLADPQWELPPTALTRNEFDRTAILKPRLPVITGQEIEADHNLTGIHVDSTGRIAVSASWTEFHDTGEQASPGREPITRADLHSQAVPLQVPPAAPGTRPQFEMQIRHDFGDTKHRLVNYTLQAAGRYREYFRAGPDRDFQRTRTQPVVNLLSTTRPPAPVVLSVLPAFRWRRTQPAPDRVEHVRAAQRLRVELARPWYVTGEGEVLAVVLAQPGGSVAPGDLITRIGRDPLFATKPIGALPQPGWFTVSPVSGVPTAGPGSALVTVLPYPVTPNGDRWFTDIDIAVPAAAQSYNPLVELALARYQPDSIRGLELSPVVRADKVPLLPDRRVVVTRSGPQVNVAVEGTSPNPPNRLDVVLETCPAGVAPEAIWLVLDDPAAEPGLAAWRPVPGQTVTRSAAGTIPALTLASVPGRMRLRIRETEPFESGVGGSPDLARRNVFVDTIVLPQEWRP